MPPIATDTRTVYQACVDILDAANTALVDNGLTPPGHQFVSFNQPAWDCCDHLITHMNVMRPIVSKRDPSCAIIYEADIILTLIGCTPVLDDNGFPPLDDEMETNAEGFYQRAWVLYTALACAYQDGTLLPSLDRCQVTKMSQLTPHGPQGGCGSITITFIVQFS